MSHEPNLISAHDRRDRGTVTDAAWYQRGLRSAANLLSVHRRILEQIDSRGNSSLAGVEVVAIGNAEIRREVRRMSAWHTECLSAHPSMWVSDTGRHHDRDFVLRGGTARSLYNIDPTCPHGLSEGARAYLQDRVLKPTTFAAPAPLQVIIANRSSVLLEGPEFGGDRSVVAISDSRAVGAALEYWTEQLSLAIPVQLSADNDPLARFTPRQRRIASMLADDLTDSAIATRLDVSVRTVQTEVAAILRLLQARSRFGAGLQLGRLGLTPNSTDDD